MDSGIPRHSALTRTEVSIRTAMLSWAGRCAHARLPRRERDMDVFMGLAFEDCCREWAGRFSADLLPPSQQLGSWWSRDGQTEIDVVGTSRGRYDLLASCKWAKAAPASALTQLLEQRDSLPRAGGAKLAIFARGFSSRLERRVAEEGVTLIGIDRLFE